MTQMYSQQKKTVVTFDILVQSDNSYQLSKLGIEVSSEMALENSFSVKMHADVLSISHIEPYWKDESKSFVTVSGERYLFNLPHFSIVEIINWCMKHHSVLNVPFAVYDSAQVLEEINK